MLAAALPIAPFVAPLLPLAIPRNRRGLRRIRSKYADVAPVKPVTNADSFRGEFPERDVTGNSLMAHIGIVWAVVNRLLAAAAKIAKEQGDDAPEVLGLTMWALAFLLDQHTHLHIAGDETNERAADGNVMQRGHHNGIFPLAALCAGGCVVMGEKIPLWCENIPDHGFDTLGARVILNKAFIGPVFVWQTLHAFGAFGGERFGGGEKTPAPAPTSPTSYSDDAEDFEDESDDDNEEAIGVGVQVEARFGGEEDWYPGTVKAVNADGTYQIAYDDGDEEDSVAPEYVRLRPSSP